MEVTRGLLAMTVAVVACGGRDSGDEAAAPPAPIPDLPDEVAAPAHAAPGGVIEKIALADGGDAALTADRFHRLRLWPSLDGKHEPVVVRGSRPAELALARYGGGWLAAVRDAGGELELVRLAADGGERGRTPVAGVDQVVAIANGVLARRGDRIVRLDARGRVLGTLAVEGDFTLHARGAAAVAELAPRGGARTMLRWLELADRGLVWGRSVELPVAVTGAFAIAPGGARAAAVVAGSRVVMLELAVAPAIVREQRAARDGHVEIGFLDDDHVLLPDGTVVAFAGSSVLPVGPRFAAAGDGVAAGAARTGLVIARRGRVQYLGYAALGWDDLGVSATGFLHRIHDARGEDPLLWLDEHLRARRIAGLPHGTSQLALDDRRVLLAVPDPLDAKRPRWTHHVVLHDTVTGESKTLVEGCQGGPVDFASFGEAPRPSIAYEPTTHVLASSQIPRTRRYTLDVATSTVTPLVALATPERVDLALFDPARAGGVVALALSGGPARAYLEFFVDGAGDPIASEVRFEIAGYAVGTDHAGRLYTIDDDGTLRIYERNQATRTLELGARFASVAVHPSGELLAVATTTELAVYDVEGTERWRVPIPNPARVVIAPSGKTVAVSTFGGLLAFDAANGKRVAQACAWGFGLRDAPTTSRDYQVPAVCEMSRGP